jgi:hypothetical protein
MPNDSGRRLRLKQSDIKNRVKDDLTAVAWKDRQNMNILINMQCPAAKGNNICG